MNRCFAVMTIESVSNRLGAVLPITCLVVLSRGGDWPPIVVRDEENGLTPTACRAQAEDYWNVYHIHKVLRRILKIVRRGKTA